MSLTPNKFIRPRLQRKTRLREIANLLLFLIAVYTVLEMAAPRSVVLSTSMQPNLVEGQRLLISRVHYLFGKPQRGDIVVFEPAPFQETQDRLIKRLIGLPGETIEFREQSVYINGKLLEESYLNEPCKSAFCPDEAWDLAADEYFMMGDNRNRSRDSRAFGPIKHQQIVGRAIVRWWPPAMWGFLTYTYGEATTAAP
ncbi:MAG: signal peptidase I [Anaerolineae bacterium]|nr:signal peptidase I [Anaerolineae bacterium]